MVILLRIFLYLVRPYENFSKVSYSKIQYSNVNLVKNLVKIIFLTSCKIYKHYTILYENLWKFLEKNLMFMYFLMHPLKNLLKLQWTFIKYENLFKKDVEGWQCPPPPLVFVSLVQWHLRDLLVFRKPIKQSFFNIWNTLGSFWRKGHSRSQKRRLSIFFIWKVTTEPIL